MTILFEAKPFLIASIGSNWHDFEHCKNAISLAKNCGADAICFEIFRLEDLYAQLPTDKPHPEGMPFEWLPKLKEKADACGIELMCTAHSPALVHDVNEFVSVLKISSSENNYPQLIEAVIATGKPVLLSVGASSLSDISAAVRYFPEDYPLVLMYCSSASPSNQINLFHMQDLAERFQRTIGLSDHSLSSVYIPLSAFHHFGAVAIEKYVNFFDVEYRSDCAHSLDAHEFKYMCDFLHGKRSHREFGPQPEEQDMFLQHNRRLMAIRDMPKDQPFVFGYNYGAFRSLKPDSYGLSPMIWRGIEGKPAQCEIKAGEPIGPKHVPAITGW